MQRALALAYVHRHHCYAGNLALDAVEANMSEQPHDSTTDNPARSSHSAADDTQHGASSHETSQRMAREQRSKTSSQLDTLSTQQTGEGMALRTQHVHRLRAIALRICIASGQTVC